jgi:dTDP-4-dehydrorhamnose reductase
LDILKPKLQSHIGVWRKIDIRDRELVARTFADFKPDYVIHLAARTDLNGAAVERYDSNTDGVEVIASAVTSTPSIKYSVFASSMLVCKMGYRPASEDDFNPSTVYGQSKVLGEKIIKEKIAT